MLFEVLLDPRRLEVADHLGVDPFGDHLGAERPRRAAGDLLVEDQRHRRGPSHVEVVADDPLEAGPSRLGPVEDPGVGDLELAEGEFVDIAGPQIRPGERGRELVDPPPKEALHRPWAESVTDPPQLPRVLTGAEAVVEGLVADPRLLQLPLGPLVAVEPDPDRPRGVGVGLPERSAPVRVPQVKVEVVHERHLPSPLHMRMAGLLLTLRDPGPPDGCLLLGDADEDHLPVPTLPGGLIDERPGHRFLVLPLLKMDHGDAVAFGEAVDGGHVAVADLPERRPRRDDEPPLPAEEPAHQAHPLQLGHIGLEEDPVDRPASERHMVPE